MNTNKTIVKYIDYTILIFVVLFLASLTNSIFINQLGYYGALVFILCRYFYTKENPFKKTGLEIPFILLIVAEILATIFSVNQSQSFYFMIKRVLIIPTFYVFIVAAQNIDRAKLLFNLFLFFTIISWIIYLFFAYDYLIHSKFSIADTGPPVYQMIITTSELVSFTVLLLFAFVINEKVNWKFRMLYIFGFCITVLALLATYKRTGWIGTAAGILAILIAKKQWKLMAIGCLALIVLFLFKKNESGVFEYSFDNSKIELINSFETEGRAHDVFYENDTMIVSDYENGLLIVSHNEIVNKIELPSAVSRFRKWKDDYYISYLADKRFILFHKTGDEIQWVDEFTSPGFVRTFDIANAYLYVNDLDSGLTIYRNPHELKDTLRYPMLNNNDIMIVDSTQILFVSQSKVLKIYKLEDYLPSNGNFIEYQSDSYTSLNYINNFVITSNWNGSRVYDIKNKTLNEISSNTKLKAIYLVRSGEEKIVMTSLNKVIYVVKLDLDGYLNIETEYSPGYLPGSMVIENDKIITSYTVQGRIKSILDPYHLTNLSRFALWRAGWEIFKDHPIVGVGDIDLAVYVKEYKRYFDKEIHGHLHNNYIHMLVTLGIIGFVAVMFLLVKIFNTNNKIYSSVKDIPFASSFALGTIGVFFSFIVSGLVEFNFGDHEIITMLWFILGFNWGIYNLTIKQDNQRIK